MRHAITRPIVRASFLSTGLLLLAVASGCGSSAQLATGRGLFWSWNDARLAADGYPGYEDAYSSPQWGVLYDEEGVAYGPRSYYEGRTRLAHPYLTVTEEYLESRWLRVYQSGCCTEALLGHFLEICDLARFDLGQKLGVDPEVKLQAYIPADLAEYERVTGHAYWVTHAVHGNAIVFSPVDVLFRRTLAAHTAFAAVAQALLDLKCDGRIPPWLREGLSSYLAEEGFEHLSFIEEFRPHRQVLMSAGEVERHVFPLLDRENGRLARYNAFLMVWRLSETYGWDRLRATLDGVERGASFEQAVRDVYGVGVDQLLTAIDPVRNGEPTTARPARTH